MPAAGVDAGAGVVAARLTLVTGATAGARERAIAAGIGVAADTASDASSEPSVASSTDTATNPTPAPAGSVAVILEGLADGHAALEASATVLISRIAPGCLCCTGNLVLRVTLNRILRGRPARLFISLASTEHLDQLRSWLQQAPYDQLLELTPDLAS
ncbi:MAG: GTPase [Massilia sp.]